MAARTTKTKLELMQTAVALAAQYRLVKHNSQLFVPVDWRNPVVTDQPIDPLETVWQPMKGDDVLQFGNDMGAVLFQNPSEFSSFQYMLMQEAARPAKPRSDEVFVKTDGGLQVLQPDGTLSDPDGSFIPNVLAPKLNPEPTIMAELWEIMVDWLVEPDTVRSLLHHLATALAPGWSAGKLVMLIGEGANGKSTLLKMLVELLGEDNISGLTRQQMAAREPSIIDLNNTLANIVFDAPMDYLKDSSTEKTLIVGEPIHIRMLYANTNTKIWTNGLFIEGLNREPKSGDKSSALQRRLVRFQFPNKYPLDLGFEKKMTSEPYVGALLALLLDHYVKSDERATKLLPTAASVDLLVDQLWSNSKVFQYVHEIVAKDSKMADKFVGMLADDLAAQLHAWLMAGKDDYSQVDAFRMLKEIFTMERKSKRFGREIKKVWLITGYTPDGQRMVDKLTEEGDDDGVLEDALVDDGDVQP